VAVLDGERGWLCSEWLKHEAKVRRCRRRAAHCEGKCMHKKKMVKDEHPTKGGLS